MAIATHLTARGLSLPRVGFGTFQLPAERAEEVVLRALEAGYRHIDTAERYGNEVAVGAAIRRSRPRGDVFVTTKIPHTEAAPEDAPSAVRRSVDALGLGYVDLVLLHWPHPDIAPELTFGALLPLVEEGVVRGLGASNFPTALLRRALTAAPLVTDQVELHPYRRQDAVLKVVADNDMALTGYAPLAEGRVFRDPALGAIAAKHGRTHGQIALRWLLDQPRVVVIPKTTHPERMRANIDVFDIDLDESDRAALSRLGERDLRFFDPPWAPVWDPA